MIAALLILLVSTVLFIWWLVFVYRCLRYDVDTALRNSDRARRMLLDVAQKGRHLWTASSTGNG